MCSFVFRALVMPLKFMDFLENGLIRANGKTEKFDEMESAGDNWGRKRRRRQILKELEISSEKTRALVEELAKLS